MTIEYPNKLSFSQYSKPAKCSDNVSLAWLLSKPYLTDDDFRELLPIRPAENQERYRYRINNSGYTPILSRMLRMVNKSLTNSPIQFDSDQPLVVTRMVQVPLRYTTDPIEPLMVEGKVYVVPDRDDEGFFLHVVPKSHIIASSFDETSDIWFSWSTRSKTVDFITLEEKEVINLHIVSQSGHALYRSINSADFQLITDTIVPYPDENWYYCMTIEQPLGLEGAQKQKQHVRTESAYMDAVTQAGYVQRVITPLESDENLESPFEEMSGDSDNATILKVKDFNFREVQGTSLDKLLNAMTSFKNDMLSLIGLDIGAATKAQSGEAKRLDLSTFLDYMMALSEEIKPQIISAYALLLRWAYGDALDLNRVVASGLDKFSREQHYKDSQLIFELLNQLGEYLNDTQKQELTSKAIELFKYVSNTTTLNEAEDDG